MEPNPKRVDRIRLINLETNTVDWHEVDTLPWNETWTISHIWDRGEDTQIPLNGVSWVSKSFSSEERFNLVFDKTCAVVKPRGAKYVWIDAACINQGRDEEAGREKAEQMQFMGSIYSKSAGSVAFGTLTPDDQFVEIAFPSKDDNRKAWVCDWFARVWTLQELQLPKEVLFVSGDRVSPRDEVYFSILMMSPYFTSPNPPLPSSFEKSNTPHVSTQDVVNALSPLSKSNTQRLMMQSSLRGCSMLGDKVYGILGVLPEPFSRLKVDYERSLSQIVLDLMVLMPSNDVLDSLVFNMLPPDNMPDTLHWSGMVRLGQAMEHPSYQKDIYPSGTKARVVAGGQPPLATTLIFDAQLWQVKVKKPEEADTDSDGTPAGLWPSIAALSQHFGLKGDFSKVERSADYADAVGRAVRSLRANWSLVEPLVDKAVGSGSMDKKLLSTLENQPFGDQLHASPPNRLGDESQFDKEVTVLVCRSKVDESFHYGIVVTPTEDNTWHKVCTAAFSNSCILTRRVERLIVIGE